MCFFSSIARCLSNIIYVVEKLISFCAFASVVTCIVATLIITLALGVGLGYNYCFIDLTTGPLDNLSEATSSKIITESETKGIAKPVTEATAKPITETLIESEAAPMSFTQELLTVESSTQNIETETVSTQVFEGVTELVSVTKQELESTIERMSITAQVSITAANIAAVTQKFNAAQKIIQNLEISADAVENARKDMEKIISESIEITTEEFETTTETIADTTQEIESLSEPEIIIDLPHSLNRRLSRTIIIPKHNTNFSSLITRLKNLHHNLTLEILA